MVVLGASDMHLPVDSYVSLGIESISGRAHGDGASKIDVSVGHRTIVVGASSDKVVRQVDVACRLDTDAFGGHLKLGVGIDRLDLNRIGAIVHLAVVNGQVVSPVVFDRQIVVALDVAYHPVHVDHNLGVACEHHLRIVGQLAGIDRSRHLLLCMEQWYAHRTKKERKKE